MIDEKVIYIPFLAFYQQRVIFAYKNYQQDNQWSISHLLEYAYQSEDLDSAKKAFSKCLKRLCPKEIWQHCGIIKTTMSFIQKYIPEYVVEFDGKTNYLKYSDFIKDFEVVEVQS